MECKESDLMTNVKLMCEEPEHDAFKIAFGNEQGESVEVDTSHSDSSTFEGLPEFITAYLEDPKESTHRPKVDKGALVFQLKPTADKDIHVLEYLAVPS
jgi:hypothetical protein